MAEATLQSFPPPSQETLDELLRTLIENYGTWSEYIKAVALLPQSCQDSLMGLGSNPFPVHPAALKRFCEMTDDKAWDVYLSKVRAAIALKPGEKSALLAAIPVAPSPAPAVKGIGRVTVSNLTAKNLTAQSLTANQSLKVPVCWANLSYGIPDTSPLANAHRLKNRQDQGERDRICNANIDDLIRLLGSRTGAAWEELKRLAKLLRQGTDLELQCFCKPHRCHADDVAFVLVALADQRGITATVAQLQARKIITQKSLDIG